MLPRTPSTSPSQPFNEKVECDRHRSRFSTASEMDPTSGSRAPKTYRGSRRRLKRIRLRDHGSWELWALLAWLAFLLFVVVPWMIRHPP